MDNSAASAPSLARKLGLFDATMIVMGGIIGSGIFVNPYVVARQVHTSALILGAWILGGLTALAGAFIYAELAILRPNLGGQYAYLREAYHPAIAFLYGWALLLIMQTEGMAAVAVTFARYAREIVHSNASDGVIATLILALLTLINCFGVRSGSSVQSSHGAENWRNRRIAYRRVQRASACLSSASIRTAQPSPAGYLRGCGDSGAVRLWRLANREFHDWRNA